MDIERPDLKKRRQRRRIIIGLVLLGAGVSASVAIARIRPAVPVVGRDEIAIDTVRRGEIVRELRARGAIAALAGDDDVRLEGELDDAHLGERVELFANGGTFAGTITALLPKKADGRCEVGVTTEKPWPAGLRVGDTVQATVKLGAVQNVLVVGRPGFGHAGEAVSMFRIDTSGQSARRTVVQLGRAGINTVEITGGLAEGDQVILSDLAQLPDRIEVRSTH